MVTNHDENFGWLTSRLLHHPTSSPLSSGASEERCAQRARSRQQRISSEPSRFAHDLMSSTVRRSALFSSVISAWLSGGFRIAKTGEGIAALQHYLPRALSRDVPISHDGSKDSCLFTHVSSFLPARVLHTASKVLPSDIPYFPSLSRHIPSVCSHSRIIVSGGGMHGSREVPQDVGCRWWDAELATPGGARARVARMTREPEVLVVKRWDFVDDDVDADLVRPQGASR